MNKIIKLHYPLTDIIQPAQQVVVMGFFDGVHLGHQAVILKGKQLADDLGLELAVLTYQPHPSVVFKMLSEPLKYITTSDKKAQILFDLGVSKIYNMQFTSLLAALQPQEFVDEVLMKLNPAVVVAGFDHLYGSDHQSANMSLLDTYAKKRFKVEIVPEISDKNGKIGSTSIKRYLSEGNLTEVNNQLGRIYTTTGIVVHGEARGRKLGFPTANILTPELERLPGIGIYSVRISIADQWYLGMASIGRNVTFGDNRPLTVEINILNFDSAIYGEEVIIEWHHYLRGEVKYDGVDSLIAQLKKDKIDTYHYFKNI